jgi:hypothetical protein
MGLSGRAGAVVLRRRNNVATRFSYLASDLSDTMNVFAWTGSAAGGPAGGGDYSLATYAEQLRQMMRMRRGRDVLGWLVHGRRHAAIQRWRAIRA